MIDVEQLQQLAAIAEQLILGGPPSRIRECASDACYHRGRQDMRSFMEDRGREILAIVRPALPEVKR